jgi:hypothetical protein
MFNILISIGSFRIISSGIGFLGFSLFGFLFFLLSFLAQLVYYIGITELIPVHHYYL